jgi:hypothetical protein
VAGRKTIKGPLKPKLSRATSSSPLSPENLRLLQSMGLGRGAKNEAIPEHDEQVLLVQWADRTQDPRTGDHVGAYLSAVPNAGKRSARAGARLKSEGLRPGYPDLIFDVACRGYHGLRIEMKRRGAPESDVRPNQREWLERLNKNGYFAYVARGFEEARELILWYLGIGDSGWQPSKRYGQETP